MALLGTVTATFASWLVDRVSTVSSNEAELRATVARLEAKLDTLLEQRSSHNPGLRAPRGFPEPRALRGAG